MIARDHGLELSLISEPGDVRLRELLLHHEVGRLVSAAEQGGRDGSLRVPDAWVERAVDLEQLLARALTRAAAGGLRWVGHDHPDWPGHLNDLDPAPGNAGVGGAPLGLWVVGAGSLASLSQQGVAIVGARDCTTYGAECAHEIAADLAIAGHTVISGAAFGVDAAAHRGALSVERPTIAVLAGGADVAYPHAHAGLLKRVAESGLVISEQPPGQAPIKSRFLSRNRVIAALSQGTVVVEAASRSGSLNTLRWADQLGRPTMGVPGPVTSTASAGVHEALREGQAVLVTSGADVMEEVIGRVASPPSPVESRFDALSPLAQRARDGLDWTAPRNAREIAALARLSVAEAERSLALLLERGQAVRVPSGWLLARRADL